MSETTLMDPEVKAEWVKRLRSGEYIQTTGALKRSTENGSRAGYCCLGVLCEIAVDRGVIPAATITARCDCGCDADQERAWIFDGDQGLPPKTVLDWAGLTDGNPSVQAGGSKTSLVALNDNAGSSFEEIADVVEEQL